MPYYHENEWLALKPIMDYPVRLSVKTLYVIGAHKFEEQDVIDQVFPNLIEINLFEPNLAFLSILLGKEREDKRITVHPYAISNHDGREPLHLTDNNGASSSLYTRRKDTSIKEIGSKEVEVRTLTTFLEDHFSARRPDALFIDTEGSEADILLSIPKDLLSSVYVIFVEASIDRVYHEKEPTFSKILDYLSDDFLLVSALPMSDTERDIGNALFVRRNLT